MHMNQHPAPSAQHTTHHTRTVSHFPLDRRLHDSAPGRPPRCKFKILIDIQSMNREHRPLVTDALVEFEKPSVQVQDFVQENCRSMWVNLQNNPQIQWRKTEKMSAACNRLLLETLGSRPILSKNLPGHSVPMCYHASCKCGVISRR